MRKSASKNDISWQKPQFRAPIQKSYACRNLIVNYFPFSRIYGHRSVRAEKNAFSVLKTHPAATIARGRRIPHTPASDRQRAAGMAARLAAPKGVALLYNRG